MAEVVVQNRGPYDWKFVLYKEGTLDSNKIHGSPEKEFFFLGKGSAPKNITLIDPTDWERLKEQYPQVNDLLKQSRDGLEVLENIPTSYYDAAHFVAIERTRANDLSRRNEELYSASEDYKKKIAELEEKLISYGAKI